MSWVFGGDRGAGWMDGFRIAKRVNKVLCSSEIVGLDGWMDGWIDEWCVILPLIALRWG